MNRPLGGGGATREGRDRALEVQADSQAQLHNVRTAAGRWQAGLAGLSGTIAIFGLVKGADDVNALSTHWGIAYGVCLAAALACSIGAGVLAMRAAFGLPRVVSTSVVMPARRADAAEARRCAGLLHAAIWLTVASIVLVAATLGVAWYAPKAAPADVVVHEISGAQDCGSVVRVSHDQLVLRTDTGQRTISLRHVDGLGGASSCPSTGG